MVKLILDGMLMLLCIGVDALVDCGAVARGYFLYLPVLGILFDEEVWIGAAFFRLFRECPLPIFIVQQTM